MQLTTASRALPPVRERQSIASIAEIMSDLIFIDYMPGSDDEWTLLNLLTIDRRARSIPVIVRTSAVAYFAQDAPDAHPA